MLHYRCTAGLLHFIKGVLQVYYCTTVPPQITSRHAIEAGCLTTIVHKQKKSREGLSASQFPGHPHFRGPHKVNINYGTNLEGTSHMSQWPGMETQNHKNCHHKYTKCYNNTNMNVFSKDTETTLISEMNREFNFLN